MPVIRHTGKEKKPIMKHNVGELGLKEITI